jgi:hypothetical protein
MVGLANASSGGRDPFYLSLRQACPERVEVGCDVEEEQEKQGAQTSAEAA